MSQPSVYAKLYNMRPLQDLHVIGMSPIPTPHDIKAELPMTVEVNHVVYEARETLKKILLREDKRLLMIVGPCSIHDPKSALEYAKRINDLREKYQDKLFIIMRIYFEKPRTTVGWKGLINDPHLDNTYDIPTGIRRARQLLLDINTLGLPAACEMLDPIIPQYIADLVSWASIGARTSESQPHREMSSGLSMPVGFKNGTDGSLDAAINAMKAATHPHCFIGIDQQGILSAVKTKGNPFCHLILRGGAHGPNYDPISVGNCLDRLKDANLPPVVMIDCSHDNSGKKPQNQELVLKDVLEQVRTGNNAIIGMMLESNLYEGNQPMATNLAQLRYGVSITDACIGWEKTDELLRYTFKHFHHYH